MRKSLLVILLALASLTLHAEPTTKQLELGRKLADLLRTQSMFEAYLKQCVASGDANVFDPKTAFRIDPGAFGGVSPQSAYWPEVETIYREYQSETCAYLTPGAFQSFYGRKYAEYATEADLQAAVEFYSSPAGARLQESSVRINEAFQGYAQELIGNASRSAYTKIGAKLKELMRKYRAEPR
jgi:Uncharacterized protein conserved in bacteria (DUF2059)